ncbi:MAG: prolipoprotein diacylglyceryl transferase [Candidatus Omnitrophica bacterium]|nr:prolipoprotein diacylglyceryl transferase [Candidatus Omnitrophota bacterium]MCM8797990.1 prolipoprotein diacylglyceryl transferase [Candidatus Omnitrophota bacterium]
MYPILFHIGPISVYSYGFMLVLAFVISTSLAKQKAKKEGISPDLIVNLSTYLLLGGIAGARLLYVFLNIEEYRKTPLQIFMLQRGGLSFYGGMLGGFLAGFLFVRKYKLSLVKTADFISPYLALGQAIGRIGCFLRGCCYGKETSFFLRVRFPDEVVFRHPTELYASLLNFFIFLFLYHSYKNKYFAGETFLIYLMLYSLKRFLLDFLRGDLPPIYFNLTIFQILSIFVFFLALSLFFYKRKKIFYEKKGI